MGAVTLFVYSPLVTGSGSEDTADIQVFLHWEDTHFYAPILPQMNARVKGKNPSEKEKSALTQTSVSGSLSILASSVGTISKIPLFSSVA